jgi:hypothetical protein
MTQTRTSTAPFATGWNGSRKVLLGHKSDHVTTHYSAPEIGALIAAAERVCELESRKSHALSLVRAQQTQVSA